jgi:photosystem II stability/assembly factor-like uncharacterized protein
VPQTIVLVATRKGLFVLESENRKDWKTKGPYCESWPLYHAIYDHDSGTIYAAAASEWLGSSVWRSSDLGETWEQSSEGLTYGDDSDLKLNKISSLSAAHGRLFVGAESCGIFESSDGGETFSLKSTLDDQPGRDKWNDHANQPPGHLGISQTMQDKDDPNHWWAIVQGHSLFETTDDAKTWTPRNKGLRADWPLENPEVGYCVHSLVRSPVDPDRFYQQNHVGTHRSDDGGKTWTEITEGLPAEFGFASVVHPHDRDTYYTIPLDPGHGRTMPDGRAGVWQTQDAGSSWRRLDQGLPSGAHVGVLRAGMAIDGEDEPGIYFGTSTGQVYGSADAGESWQEIAAYLPGISSVEVAVVG